MFATIVPHTCNAAGSNKAETFTICILEQAISDARCGSISSTLRVLAASRYTPNTCNLKMSTQTIPVGIASTVLILHLDVWSMAKKGSISPPLLLLGRGRGKLLLDR